MDSMTDFQWSLVAAGVAFILVLVIYNRWQEYRAKKSVDRAFMGSHDDVLMNPKSDSNAGRQEPQMPTPDEFDESLQIQGEEAERKAAAQIEYDEQLLSVDDLIDCVIAVEFESPIRGEKLLLETSGLNFVGRKAVNFIGLSHQGERAEIAHGGKYTTLFAGIQMVNRSGPLNELEYSEFVSKIREIADRLNAHPDIPDMNQVMSNARELQQFVAGHDAQLSVNIAANGAPWDITTLLSALEKQGFDVRPDGRLVMPDGDVGNLFTLSTNVSASETVTARLTLLLDVPCVAPDSDAFGTMSACARNLATRLGGSVVDDSQQAISKEALAEIADQVRDFYQTMARAEVPAGSRRAKRLFS